MRSSRILPAALVVASFVVAVFACGGKRPPPKEPAVTETITDAGAAEEAEAAPPAPKSLYERLGGKDAIAKVVDTFVKNVAADNKISKRFAKLKGDKLDKFKANLTDQICEAASPEGAPVCKYGGKSMKDVHKGLKIKEDEWNALLADLKAAMEENSVGESEQADLMALLGPMHDDIVEVKPKEKPAGKK